MTVDCQIMSLQTINYITWGVAGKRGKDRIDQALS